MGSRLVLSCFGLLVGVAACSGGGGGGSPTVPPTISLAGLPPGGTLSANASYQITAIETIGGASATPGTLTLTLDNASLGTISGSTLVAGLANSTGKLTVTDASHNLSATASLTVASTHPVTTGDKVTFVGTIAQTITRPYPAPITTQPPSNSTTDVTISTTTSTGATLGTLTGLTDFKSVENDTSRSPAITNTTTTDTYQTQSASGSNISILNAGSVATDSNGNAFTTTFGAGNGILDVLPETNGATFTNNAALTYAENDSDTTSVSRTVAGDGSYVENDAYPDTTGQTITVNGDLSATIGTLRGTSVSVAVSAPAPAATGTGSTINYALSFPNPTPSSTPTVINITLLDWYPSNSLTSDSTTTTLAQPIPADCNLPPAVGTLATVLAETNTSIDPALGTLENRTTTSYLAPFVGLACVKIADRLDDYYDYTGQQPGIVRLRPTATKRAPLQTTVTTETIGLKTDTIAGAPTSSLRARTAAAASSRVGPIANTLSLGIVKASFDRAMARVYAKRHRELRDTLLKAQSPQQVVR